MSCVCHTLDLDSNILYLYTSAQLESYFCPIGNRAALI